jgi:hypothetical protein
MRVMFVGDSQTIGSAGDFTWRYRMWQHLSATYGGPFRIVGPRTELYDKQTDTPDSLAYGDPAFPERARAHLAGWGEGWGHMAPLIRDAVRQHRPGLLLIALGLIDLGFYTDAEQTADSARLFVEEARAADPHIRMVIMPVIPNTRAENDPPFADECARFNELLAKAVADLSTPSSPILLTSRPRAYDLHTDTYDGTHPSTSGEHKVAAEFAEALHQAWGVGGPYEGA